MKSKNSQPEDSPENHVGDFVPADHIKRLSSGCILLARQSLLDPNFKGSKILICRHNEQGAYGLVLNCVTHMPLSEVFEGQGFEAKNLRPIFIGGPVQSEELQVLQITENPAFGAMEILPNLFLGGEWASIQSILDIDLKTSRLFLGYSGWGVGQLENEIAAGSWEVLNIDVKAYLLSAEEHGDISQFNP